MSLLLKALEKSDEEGTGQETTPAAVAPAPAAASTGGMKLGGGQQVSKLGSALGAQKAKVAKKVVAAFDEEVTPSHQDEDANLQRDLQQAQRKASVRNITLVAVVVVVGAGGWFGYTKFFPTGLDREAVEETVRTTTQAVLGGQQEQLEEEAFLPLAEPIYDIQENILAASTSPLASNNSGAENNTGDVAKQVESYVQRILEEQQRKTEEIQAASSGSLQVKPSNIIGDELGKLLSEEVDWKDLPLEITETDMITRLESLSTEPYRKGKQFIISGELAATAEKAAMEKEKESEAGNADANAASESSQSAAKPVQIARSKSSGLGKKMEEGVTLYRSGDLNGSELAFRSILAADPKNSQALVGLAKIHQARGNVRLAVVTLLKAAEYKPNDLIVLSELIALQSASTDSLISVGPIFGLLARTNDQNVQAKLFFLLGTHSAKKKDWLEAKANFLNAYSLNQTNPDIAYNLAVVYDYLGESDEAANMYRSALSSALLQPSSFNHQTAKERANLLESQ